MKERGNALFLLLIAVALFAALSYAVTQSSRGGGSVDKETSALAAARIVSFSGFVQQAMQKIMLLQNVAIQDLSFGNSVYKSIGGTAFNGTMASPAVFDPQDGGVTPLLFDNVATGSCSACVSGDLAPGHFLVFWAQIPGVGTTEAELALAMAQPSDNICQHINKSENISPTLPVISFVGGNAHKKGNAIPSPGAFGGPDIAAITGKQAFCLVTNDAKARNIYMYILVPR